MEPRRRGAEQPCPVGVHAQGLECSSADADGWGAWGRVLGGGWGGSPAWVCSPPVSAGEGGVAQKKVAPPVSEPRCVAVKRLVNSP